MDIYNPDTTITASDLESLALEHLGQLPIRGVEGRPSTPTPGQPSFTPLSNRPPSTTSPNKQLTHRAATAFLSGSPLSITTSSKIRSNDALARQARRMLLKTTPRSICLDFVDIHYHGRYHLTKAELCSTTSRDGTTKCHRYCAAFVLCRGKPLILAFTWMHGDESRDVAAKRVLGRVVDLNLTIEYLLADRAFASAADIDAMQTTTPIIAPLIRRGKELAKRLDTHVSYWIEYAMYEGTAREVRFPLAICVSYQQGKRGKPDC